MAGTVRHAKLDSPTARSKLKRQKQPHWQNVVPGKLHLGYRREKGPKDKTGGHWVLRRYTGGKYSVMTLGRADDEVAANGTDVLSHSEALARINALVDTPNAPVGRLTVRRLMVLYAEFLQSRGQSVYDLNSRVRVHILPHLGDLIVAELTSEILRRWLVTIVSQPAQNRPRGGMPRYRAAPSDDEAIRKRRSSANRVLTMLRAALNWCFREGHVKSDLAWRRVEPFRSVDSARVRYLSVAEAQRLLNAADDEFKPLLTCALLTGARYGELTKLKVEDFNADAGTLAIRRSKSGKSRHVHLTEEGTEFFRSITVGRAGGEFMLIRHHGQPWERSGQGMPMLRACERARIVPPVGLHIMRHTYASLSVMGGMPLPVLAENLGHTSTKMTEKHYAHLSKGYVQETIRATAPRFGVVSTRQVVPIIR